MAGRRPKLTPEIQKSVVKILAHCGRVEDACVTAGISISTFYQWKAQGQKQSRGAYRDFLEALERAEVQRRLTREAKILKAGEKDWRAIAWMMERTEPKRYAPRVLVHVEQELTDAVARLKEAFREDPEALERALHAIASPDSGAGTGVPEAGEDAEDDPDGGEAVLATRAEP